MNTSLKIRTDSSGQQWYCHVADDNTPTYIYCGNDPVIAEKLKEMLDEVYWYRGVTPCHNCGLNDYQALADIRMAATVSYAHSVGVELISTCNFPN